MNNIELDHALSNNAFTKKYFTGVFPACQHPPKRRIYSFVTNTDCHTQPGKHWCAWFIRHNHVVFFDSFGRSPCDKTLPENYRNFIGSFRSYDFVKTAVQRPESVFCGQHCMHFLLVMSLGLSVSDFLKDYEYYSVLQITNSIF